jgi:hypothetical protein
MVLDTARVTSNIGEPNGIRVLRTTRVEVDGRDSRLLFDYEITDATGTRHESEVHHLGLFTHDEMLEAFRQAGFTAEHDPVGLCDRGLSLARPRHKVRRPDHQPAISSWDGNPCCLRPTSPSCSALVLYSS